MDQRAPEKLFDTIYRAIANVNDANRASRINQSACCDSYVTCGFLGAAEEHRKNHQLAPKYYSVIDASFVTAWSGASTDPDEIDRISRMALEEGHKFEMLGHYGLARTYFRIAGKNVIDLTSNEDPLRNLDDTLAADSLARVLYKAGDVKLARKLTSALVSSARKRFNRSAVFGTNFLIRSSHRLRGIFETHLNLVNPLLHKDENNLNLDFFALQYLQTTRTSATLTKMAARMGAQGGSIAREHQDKSAKLALLYEKLSRTPEKHTRRLLSQISQLETDKARLEKSLKKKRIRNISTMDGFKLLP